MAQTDPDTPDPTPTSKPILEVRDLRTSFPMRSGALQRITSHHDAVAGVSFDLGRGEVLGLVGESGSGKTTVGRTILRILPSITGLKIAGSVRFAMPDGRRIDVLSADRRDLFAFRRQAQIIFQDPAGSLNPRMRVWEIVSEPLVVHGVAHGRNELRDRAQALLERCGMPGSSADLYPHEFSGGQRQRIGIARSLALEPSLIICDEPTSALDVSIQAQIINLLADLRTEMGLSYLFISHDMGVISHLCDRIAVMKDGELVEVGRRDQVLGDPQHEYTQRLLAAVPEAPVA